MVYIKLFITFIIIGALSFGGGYSTLSLINELVIKQMAWITKEQLCDVITLSELTPGPIALNAASFTGYTVGGIAGSLAATVGCVLPSCALMSIITYAYTKYKKSKAFSSIIGTINPAVCSLMFSAFFTMFLPVCFGIDSVISAANATINIVSLGIFAAAFIAVKTNKIPPIIIILLCGILSAVLP
jgi:chromate transporter